MSNSTVQLEPLSKRLSAHQQQKRAIKIGARRLVAEQLSRENAITRGFIAGFVQMGFWARLRWLFFGLPRPRVARDN